MGIVHAQSQTDETADICFSSRPASDCNLFVLTNAGVFFSPGKDAGGGDDTFRAMADWGVMKNLDEHHAVGGSWFFIADHEDHLSTGPMVRYRRWLGRGHSVEVGLGAPVVVDSDLQTGSVFALVKYNPVHWLGVVLRPEYARHRTSPCDESGCATESSVRFYGGVEFDWYPGLGLSIGGGGFLATVAILFSGID